MSQLEAPFAARSDRSRKSRVVWPWRACAVASVALAGGCILMGEFPGGDAAGVDTSGGGAAEDGGSSDGGSGDGGSGDGGSGDGGATDGGSGDGGSGDAGSDDGGDGGDGGAEVVVSDQVLVTDSEGTAESACFSIPTAGDVYGVTFSHASAELGTVVLYPQVAAGCTVADTGWASAYDCAVAPYVGFDGGSAAWKPGYPRAELQLNIQGPWCVLVFYATDNDVPLDGGEIGLTVTQLDASDVGAGVCGESWEYTQCLCDDPAPAACPTESAR